MGLVQTNSQDNISKPVSAIKLKYEFPLIWWNTHSIQYSTPKTQTEPQAYTAYKSGGFSLGGFGEL